VDLTHEDGTTLRYLSDGAGGYTLPPGVFRKLKKDSETVFTLTEKTSGYPIVATYRYDTWGELLLAEGRCAGQPIRYVVLVDPKAKDALLRMDKLGLGVVEHGRQERRPLGRLCRKAPPGQGLERVLNGEGGVLLLAKGVQTARRNFTARGRKPGLAPATSLREGSA